MSKAERMLKRVAENLNSSSVFRISKRGVPHLIVEKRNTKYSICYFGRHKSFRIFYPYLSYSEQTKIDLKLWHDVVNYFKEIK